MRTTTIRTLIQHTAALLASAAALAWVSAPAAAATEDPSWSVATVSNVHGHDRQNFLYSLDPAATLEDALTVVNDGATPIDLDLYAADAFTTDAGHLDVRTAADESTDVGAWVEPARDRVSLRPGESVDVPFTVTVPADAAPGDHVGGIVTSLTTTGGGSTVEQRQAIRVQVRVAGSADSRVSAEDVAVDHSGGHDGGAVVSYTLRNTGGTILAADQSVAITGPFGSFRREGDPIERSPQLLPGESWPVSVRVPDVAPTGLLTATVSVVPLYTDAAGSTAPLAAVEHTGHGWAVPWVGIVGAIVLVAFVAVLVLIRRRRPPELGRLTTRSATRTHGLGP